jgi:phage shock protein A
MGLEQQFAQLESNSGVDDELAAMKAALSGSSPNQNSLPPGATSSNPPKDSAIDDELEALRRQLNE